MAGYGVEMAQVVGDAVSIEPTTLKTIQEDAEARRRVALADLVITFSHRRRDVMDLLLDIVVAAVTFIPVATTRRIWLRCCVRSTSSCSRPVPTISAC